MILDDALGAVRFVNQASGNDTVRHERREGKIPDGPTSRTIFVNAGAQDGCIWLGQRAGGGLHDEITWTIETQVDAVFIGVTQEFQQQRVEKEPAVHEDSLDVQPVRWGRGRLGFAAQLVQRFGVGVSGYGLVREANAMFLHLGA